MTRTRTIWYATYAKHLFRSSRIQISRIYLLSLQIDSRPILNQTILRQYGAFVGVQQPILFISIVFFVFEAPHVNVLTQITRIVCIWQTVASHIAFPLKNNNNNNHFAYDLFANKMAIDINVSKLVWHHSYLVQLPHFRINFIDFIANACNANGKCFVWVFCILYSTKWMTPAEVSQLPSKYLSLSLNWIRRNLFSCFSRFCRSFASFSSNIIRSRSMSSCFCLKSWFGDTPSWIRTQYTKTNGWSVDEPLFFHFNAKRFSLFGFCSLLVLFTHFLLSHFRLPLSTASNSE